MKVSPNDPAFPRAIGWNGLDNHEEHETSPGARGLTIRAEFAKAAMQALISSWSHRDNQKYSSLSDMDRASMFAHDAVMMADALIGELNKE